MRFSVRIIFIFAVLQIFLLGGCTTMVASAYKDEAYNKQLTETAVVWLPPENLSTSISRVGYGGITPGPFPEKEKNKLLDGVTELLALFSEHSPNAMENALTVSKVKVVPQKTSSETELSILPVRAEIQCAALGCQHSLWIRVTLSDKLTKKTIWWASFKVGAPFVVAPVKADEAVVQNFTNSVISELKNARLL